MKPRALVNFAVVTAVVTAAALVTVANRYWISEATSSVKPFPGLLDRINDVAEIDIKSRDGNIAITRSESGWIMAEKQNYPVKPEMAKGAAIGIGDMEFTERKTAQPDRFSRLGVEDVDAKDAKSRLVTLKNAKGETMAELIVGRPREGRMGGQGGLYVRRPGEAQAWFGPANFEIPNNPAVWLVARIVHVNPKRVARITTIQPDGEKLVLFKETPETAHFAFKDLPSGKTLKGEAVADDMNSILTAIDLTDVAPQSEIDFAKKVWHAEIETFDGLTVKVDLVDRGGKPWARFGAAAGKPMTDRGSQSEDVQKFLKTADEVAKEAGEMNARVANWAYELQGPQASKLEANLAIFLEAEGPPSESGPMGGFGPAGPGGLGGLPEGPPADVGN